MLGISLVFSLVFVPLLACGLGGFYISSEKGRGGWDGFWFGLTLGLFGLLIAVLMPQPPVRRPAPMSVSELWRRSAMTLGILWGASLLADITFVGVARIMNRYSSAHNHAVPAPGKPESTKPMPVDPRPFGSNDGIDPSFWAVIGVLALATGGFAVAYVKWGPARDGAPAP
jgi:hypothetical protein